METATLDYETPSNNPEEPAKDPPGIYSCGTLKYTIFGLIMVFVWLLWGDFIWTLMDGVVPKILPLKLKEMGSSDTLNQILNRSIPSLIIFIFAPIVSFSSDRHRGPLGRRRPYLLWSTPFVGLFMVLMGYHESLTKLFMGDAASISLFHLTITRKAAALAIFGTVFVGYNFSNIFVNTVYWYLFNDVVPSRFLSRFLSLFRIVGAGAGMIYNYYIKGYALVHFRLIFVIAGIAYVVGFMLMCFFLREGEYPPPSAVEGTPVGFFSRIISLSRTYAKECFTHRFYWLFFLSNTFHHLSNQAGNFNDLRDLNSLKVSLELTGKVGFWTGLVSLLMQYPAGWLSDKFNPLRVYMVTRTMSAIGLMIPLVWIFKDFGVSGNLKLMYFMAFLFLPFDALTDAAEIPMYMRLLPRMRYGQFCSANAMMRSFVAFFGSMVAGVFMDILSRFEHVRDWHYRYAPVWTITFQIPSIILLYMLFREWKRRGGNAGYTPP